MTPNPRRAERPLTPERAAAGRRLACIRARECLTVAAANNWPSFTCASCPVDDREPPPLSLRPHALGAEVLP